LSPVLETQRIKEDRKKENKEIYERMRIKTKNEEDFKLYFVSRLYWSVMNTTRCRSETQLS
jgi:hypothetical protein